MGDAFSVPFILPWYKPYFERTYFKIIWAVINKHSVFSQISAAALIKVSTPQIRHLFEGGVYLKELVFFYLV